MIWEDEIAERLRTQDNRCTAEPIYLVQQRKRIYGVDENYTEKIAWVSSDEGIEASPEEAKAADERYEESGQEPEDFSRVGYVDEWEFVTACLTLKGAEAFIAAQKHNLTDPRIFVDSGHNNSEWKALRRYFLDKASEGESNVGTKV
jgi:hypothetical protein